VRKQKRNEVDLTALLAMEAERVGAGSEGPPVQVVAEPRMLRRLVRNLLENARRHGGGGAISAGVEPQSGTDGGVRLWVAVRVSRPRSRSAFSSPSTGQWGAPSRKAVPVSASRSSGGSPSTTVDPRAAVRATAAEPSSR
jgi:hypothetical protein